VPFRLSSRIGWREQLFLLAKLYSQNPRGFLLLARFVLVKSKKSFLLARFVLVKTKKASFARILLVYCVLVRSSEDSLRGS
jgi:hypothetical protein